MAKKMIHAPTVVGAGDELRRGGPLGRPSADIFASPVAAAIGGSDTPGEHSGMHPMEFAPPRRATGKDHRSWVCA